MLLPLLALAAAMPAGASRPAPAVVARLPQCAGNAISIGTDGLGGYYSGMQKGGTLLVIRNMGPVACRLDALPELRLKDKNNKLLPIARKAPVGMHPGPVMLPVGVAVGAEATADVTWIAGPVFARNSCFDVAYAATTIGGVDMQMPFPAHICGENGRAGFNQAPLHTDPTL